MSSETASDPSAFRSDPSAHGSDPSAHRANPSETHGIGPVVTAMITPFGPDGALDLDGAQKVADHLVATGTDTVLVNGTTGESPTLTGEEPWQVLEVVREAVGDRASVMIGTGTNSTASSVAATGRAADAGADAVLVVTPYYNRPDQRGVLQHIRTVAGVTPLPVMLYDIPNRTGRAIDVATYIELCEIENVVGVKDATGDLGKAGDVLVATAGAPGGFSLWSGSDEVNLPLLAVGAAGIVSVAAHLAGPELSAMVAAAATDPVRARTLHLACMPLHRALFIESSPGPLKGAMNALGLPAGPVRPPLADASEEAVEAVLAALAPLEATR